MRNYSLLLVGLLLASASFAQSPFPCELSGGEGDPATGGLSETQVGQYHDNSNFFNVIELYEPVTLVSAKVFANGAGPRTLALFSPEGDVLMTEVVDIPDGESIVEFGWDVGPGTVGLGSLSADPQLWRDDLNSDINFPYPIGEYGAITGTSIQGQNEFNYYYFFYNWVVQTPFEGCPSDRVPVTITVVGMDEATAALQAIYPNPTNGQIQLTTTEAFAAAEWSLINALGQQVASGQLNGTVSTLNFTDQATGQYMLQLRNDSNVNTVQLIIE